MTRRNSAGRGRKWSIYQKSEKYQGKWMWRYLDDVTARSARKAAHDYARSRNEYPSEFKAVPAGSSPSGKKYNPAKRVVLKNFTGTITKNANGTVSIKGRKK
jgi:hypothetical protein